MTTLLDRRVDAVRRFNRFYTQRIGVLEHHYQHSPFSLAQARVLFELIRHGETTASRIARDLGLDDGYLSRILRGFEKDGLIRRAASKTDGRQSLLKPTARGRQRYAALEAATRQQTGAMLEALPPAAQQRVVTAMATITATLAPPEDAPAIALRAPQPGDFGWIVERHAVLYARDYGWTEPFEGLCAQIIADFANTHDPKRERCWIAERDGEAAGSIFLVKDADSASGDVARIRLLLVEPWARGAGIGERLVQECIAFARGAGYRRITLWTHSILTGARRIYRRAGFVLTASQPHQSWGKPVVGETWDLQL